MAASWTTPVYDRTALDVENRTAKGYYNYGDINRIEENLEYLRDYAATLGFTLSVTADYTWTASKMFDDADDTRVIGNIKAAINGYRYIAWLDAPPTDFAYMTYAKANTIERILHDLKWMMDNEALGNGFNIAGISYAGTGGLI